RRRRDVLLDAADLLRGPCHLRRARPPAPSKARRSAAIGRGGRRGGGVGPPLTAKSRRSVLVLRVDRLHGPGASCHEVISARRLGIAEGKRDFSDVLGAVRHKGERFIIERRGTPVAAIVPVEDLARLESKKGGGVLTLVGAFDDAQELPEILDEIV